MFPTAMPRDWRLRVRPRCSPDSKRLECIAEASPPCVWRRFSASRPSSSADRLTGLIQLVAALLASPDQFVKNPLQCLFIGQMTIGDEQQTALTAQRPRRRLDEGNPDRGICLAPPCVK